MRLFNDVIVFPTDDEVVEIVMSRAGIRAFNNRELMFETFNLRGLKTRLAIVQNGDVEVNDVVINLFSNTTSEETMKQFINTHGG